MCCFLFSLAPILYRSNNVNSNHNNNKIRKWCLKLGFWCSLAFFLILKKITVYNIFLIWRRQAVRYTSEKEENWNICVWALSFDQLKERCGVITPLNFINSLNRGCVWGNSTYEKLWNHLDNRENVTWGRQN